jgi:tetratricopeptide (TPR) repeat protein
MKYLLLALILTCTPFLTYSQNFDQFYNAGVRLLDDGKYNESIESFSKALEKKHLINNSYKIADAYVGIGLCRYYLGSLDRAEKDYKAAIELTPEYSKPYYLLANVYLQQKKTDAAHKAVDKSLGLKPNHAGAMTIKRRILHFEKRYQEEVALCNKMIELDASSNDLYKRRGDAYQALKKPDSAMVDFNKAIALNPNDADAFYERGYCYAMQKEYEKGAADMELAVKMDSTKAILAYNDIAFYMKFAQKDWKGAIAYFDKAIALKPGYAYAYSNRGYAKHMLGDNNEALKDIRKSIELDPTNSWVFKNYAIILFAEDKRKDACFQLERAVKLGYTKMYDNEVVELQQKNCN